MLLAFQNRYPCWKSSHLHVQDSMSNINLLLWGFCCLFLNVFSSSVFLSSTDINLSRLNGGKKWGSSCAEHKQLNSHYWSEWSVLKSPLPSAQWPWRSLKFRGKQYPFLKQKGLFSVVCKILCNDQIISRTEIKYLVSFWLPLGISSVIEQHFPLPTAFEVLITFHMLHRKACWFFSIPFNKHGARN